MATESEREARRKRILDRGSDRLAFITGQGRSLPPSAVSTSPPPPPQLGRGEVEEPVPDAVNSSHTSVGHAGDGVATGYELPKCEPSNEPVRDTIDRSASIETSPEHEISNEPVDTMQQNNVQMEPAPVTLHGSRSQVVNSEPQRRKRHMHEIFTAKRISSSISASENIRMLCATFIALLVVLSYHGYPLLGEALGNIISFRPIFLVLLTDATLVVGILFTTKWEEKDEADAGNTGQGSKDWTDQIGEALEALLISQKVASAVFLDCSFCAVIIICSTSFNRTP